MATDKNTPKPGALWVGVNLDGMTWGELRAFVNICRDVPDYVEVGQEHHPDSYDLVGLRECIPVDGGADGS